MSIARDLNRMNGMSSLSSRIAGIEDYRRIPCFNVAENAKILLRYEYLERRLLRIMAGWIPGTARWEAKFLLGRLVWEDAEHTQSLRSRILELRTSERILDRAPSPHLALVMDELLLASDWCEFLIGVSTLEAENILLFADDLPELLSRLNELGTTPLDR